MNGRITWALLGATGLALGLAMPLGKLAVAQGVGPLSFALLPALAAGLLLAGLGAWRHGRPGEESRLLRFGLVTGLLGVALPNTLTAWLSARAGASFSAIAYTLPPLFTLAFLIALRWERLSLRRAAAVALGLGGALWLSLSRSGGGSLSLLDALLLLLIPASLGAGNVYRARFLPPGVPVAWLGAAMSLGACVLLLPVWWLAPPAASGLTLAGGPWLAAQAVAASVGLLLFYALQRRAEPVTLSFVGYAIALTAVIVGAGVLGEPLPWQLGPAVLLIGAGFWLIQQPPRPAAAAQPPVPRPALSPRTRTCS